MDISFNSKDLRKLCQSRQVATRKLGIATAEKLANRLDDILAATTAKDLVIGSPRHLRVAGQEALAIALSKEISLVISCNHAVSPKLETGHIDWNVVSRVKIMKIGPVSK